MDPNEKAYAEKYLQEKRKHLESLFDNWHKAASQLGPIIGQEIIRGVEKRAIDRLIAAARAVGPETKT